MYMYINIYVYIYICVYICIHIYMCVLHTSLLSSALVLMNKHRFRYKYKDSQDCFASAGHSVKYGPLYFNIKGIYRDFYTRKSSFSSRL